MSDLRDYRKQLLLYCLHLESPLSVSALCQNMSLVAQQELHPRGCWDDLTPSHVASLIKELVIARHVTQSRIVARNANGRLEARWELAMKCDARPLPKPPNDKSHEAAHVWPGNTGKAHRPAETEGIELTFRLTEERAESLRQIVKDVNLILEQYDKHKNDALTIDRGPHDGTSTNQ